MSRQSMAACVMVAALMAPTMVAAQAPEGWTVPRLADGRPEGRASGREWRTAPLWGIGLTETVNGHSQFLHDGRARNLLEAILWHGGEAEAAKETVKAMLRAEREALLAFLGSL